MSLHSLPPDPGGQNPATEHSNPEQYLNQELRVEHIPEQLKARPQWVLWRYVKKPSGKLDKVAFQPNYTGSMARTNDPSTWSTFDKALEVFKKNSTFDGIGYVFSKDDPYVGFDWDGCLDPETGELHEAVSRQVKDLDSYVEISPSGSGLKGIVRARKPGTRCSTKQTPWGDEFAVYEHSRFFTLTGLVFGDHTKIREAQEAADRAYHEAFGETEEKPSPPSGGGVNTLTYEELIERACKSKKGERFRRHHFEGDATGYSSRSEADFVHLADLCFWSGGDVERMVELFSRSALYLPQKGRGYVRRSARKAIIAHQGGYYQGKKEETPKEVLELVEELERLWWDETCPGVGGKTDASIRRALLRVGKRVGSVDEDGGLRVSISVRQLAEIVGCHVNTIVAFTKRDTGFIRKDDFNRRTEDSGTFILLDPRLPCDTPEDTAPPRVFGGVTTSSRPEVADLRTKHFRWRGPVGKGRERLLCALEAFGPQSAEELADRLGWSRARDFRRLHLDPLEGLGLVEEQDGIWALPGDCDNYQRRQEEVRRIPYSTVQDRAKRTRSTEGLWVTVVETSGSVASEEERADKDRESYARQRAGFRHYLEERRKAKERRSSDEELEITALLNSWDDERAEAAGTVSELEPVDGPEEEHEKPVDAVFAALDILLLGDPEAAEELVEEPPRPEPDVETQDPDWMTHPLACECGDCVIPDPVYARPAGGSLARV